MPVFRIDETRDDAVGTGRAHGRVRQTDYDNRMAEIEEKNNITEEEKAAYKKMSDVAGYFIERNFMRNNCGIAEKIIQLRKLLCVSDLTSIPKITYSAAYRAQIENSTAVSPYVLFAWQRLCEIETGETKTAARFDAGRLRESIPEIKKQMFESDAMTMSENLRNIFSECGVAFGIVRHFRGAPVQGFIKRTDAGKAILCVTFRGKSADRFWFTLFHEIGHLVNVDLNNRFVDFDSVKSETEDAADLFARDALIGRRQYEKIIDSEKYANLSDIKRFAKDIGVPHWILIGRLHKDEWLDWKCFSREIPKFEWENISSSNA